MIIYVWSATLSAIERLGQPFTRHASVPAAEIAHVMLQPGAVHAVHEVVDMIKAAAQNRGSIHLLIFNSHGRITEMLARDGHRRDLRAGLAMEEGGGLWTADALPSFFTLDDPAGSWFSSGNEGIELHACNIAHGMEGRQFCQTMANHTGVRVYGGLDEQLGTLHDVRSVLPWRGYEPDPESDPHGYFEGPTLCFERGAINPRDAAEDLRARGAWRRGTPFLYTPHEVDIYELDHPAHVITAADVRREGVFD